MDAAEICCVLETCQEERAEIGPKVFPFAATPTTFPPAGDTDGRVVQMKLMVFGRTRLQGQTCLRHDPVCPRVFCSSELRFLGPGVVPYTQITCRKGVIKGYYCYGLCGHGHVSNRGVRICVLGEVDEN